MKTFLLTLLLLSTAHAQIPPLRFKNASGVRLPYYPTVNLVTGTCTPNSASNQIDCAFGSSVSSVLGLSAAYNGATATSHNTLSLTNGRGGLILQDASTPLDDPLFKITNSSGLTSYFFVNGPGPGQSAGAIGPFNFGATVNRYFALNNTTAATSGVPVQYSPFDTLQANGWDTDDLVSRSIRFFWGVQPASNATVTGDLVWYYKRDSGANVEVMRASTAGDLTLVKSVVAPNATLGRVTTSGTAHVAGDYAPSAEWGSTASVTVSTGSNDVHFRAKVTASGSGISANPTLVLTFKDGTWTNAPFPMIQTCDATNSTDLGTAISWTVTATAITITWFSTPTSGRFYEFCGTVIGR